MSCGGNMYEDSGNESFHVDVKAYTTMGFTLFVWRHEIDWSWSVCRPDCSGCFGAIENHTIDDYSHNSYSVETDSAWSYQGTVSKEIGVHEEGSVAPYVRSFRQDLYEGFNVFGIPTGSLNPSAELEGDGWGNGEIISADNDQ